MCQHTSRHREPEGKQLSKGKIHTGMGHQHISGDHGLFVTWALERERKESTLGFMGSHLGWALKPACNSNTADLQQAPCVPGVTMGTDHVQTHTFLFLQGGSSQDDLTQLSQAELKISTGCVVTPLSMP